MQVLRVQSVEAGIPQVWEDTVQSLLAEVFWIEGSCEGQHQHRVRYECSLKLEDEDFFTES